LNQNEVNLVGNKVVVLRYHVGFKVLMLFLNLNFLSFTLQRQFHFHYHPDTSKAMTRFVMVKNWDDKIFDTISSLITYYTCIIVRNQFSIWVGFSWEHRQLRADILYLPKSQLFLLHC